MKTEKLRLPHPPPPPSGLKEKGQEKGELKVVSQEKSEEKEDGHKRIKVKVENRIIVR